MLRPIWLIPTLLSFSRPRRSVAWSTFSPRSSRFRCGHGLPSDGPYYGGRPSSSVSASSSDPVSVNTNDKDFHKKALALDLPVESFGGLSYWNTQNRKAFRVVFVLGGPGAGKGTQSAFLEENYPVVHFSVGELLRAEQEKMDSPHRALIEDALVSGKIVPVEISLSLLRQAMQEKADSEFGDQCIFLVDGFPRNDDNLSGWCRFMTASSDVHAVADLWGVLVYQCPVEVLETRILERAKESGRSDDNLESVRKRFKTFQDQTQPIIDELDNISKHLADETSAKWKVWQISGDQPLPDVTKNTRQMMNQLIQNDILSANQRLLQAIEKGDVQTYKRLCDPLLFEEKDAGAVLQEQEGVVVDGTGKIVDAGIEFVTGKHAIVKYKRQIEGQDFVEARVWVHEGTNGWVNVHFSRTPTSP